MISGEADHSQILDSTYAHFMASPWRAERPRGCCTAGNKVGNPADGPAVRGLRRSPDQRPWQPPASKGPPPARWSQSLEVGLTGRPQGGTRRGRVDAGGPDSKRTCAGVGETGPGAGRLRDGSLEPVDRPVHGGSGTARHLGNSRWLPPSVKQKQYPRAERLDAAAPRSDRRAVRVPPGLLPERVQDFHGVRLHARQRVACPGRILLSFLLSPRHHGVRSWKDPS
jgi:hypothetical protein